MEEEKDDPFKLVELGLAKPSQLHPRHMTRLVIRAVNTVRGLSRDDFYRLTKAMGDNLRRKDNDNNGEQHNE